MTTAQDDSAADVDILCPLCEYNLRGLPEARCPECGAVFNWDELRDPARRLHPYLFEHHPERNVSSLRQTLVGGLLPRRFWRTLSPVQPSRPRRMMLYWVLCMMLASVGLVGSYAIQCIQLYRSTVEMRGINEAFFNGTGKVTGPLSPGRRTATTQEINEINRKYGSITGFLDTLLPLPPSPRFFMLAMGINDPRYGRLARTDLLLVINLVDLAVAAVWPWAMVGLLWLVFAIVRTVQASMSFARQGNLQLTLDLSRAIIPMIAILLLTYRLGCAMSKYLRFRHAMAMAISVQMIFALLVAVGFQFYDQLSR